MPIKKLSADGGPQTDQIIRVEITAQTLNEKNEDGSWKFNDDQLRDWLVKLRGDREITVAKKVTREAAAKKGGTFIDDDDDDTDGELSDF